jgi:hypothetical protein
MSAFLHPYEMFCAAELNRSGGIIDPDLIGKGAPLLVSFCSLKDGTVPYLTKTFDFGVEDPHRTE